MSWVGQGDVFQETDMYVVLEIGVKIQQYKQAILCFSLDVIQKLLRLLNRMRRLVAGIERLKPFCDRPAIGLELQALADLADDGDDLRFFVALDGDQWHSG